MDVVEGSVPGLEIPNVFSEREGQGARKMTQQVKALASRDSHAGRKDPATESKPSTCTPWCACSPSPHPYCLNKGNVQNERRNVVI